MCKYIPAANIPQANPGYFIHGESWETRHLVHVVNSVLTPGLCKQQKTCFVTSRHHFQQRSEVKDHFGYKRAHFNLKKAIKTLIPFALSLFGQ